jgi:hypothetical protein
MTSLIIFTAIALIIEAYEWLKKHITITYK